MIHAIRKLARAIRRRPVWLVLCSYLAGSWALFQGVALTTQAAGLPAWTPSLALVLLVTMLPLVVATAVVQGGLPGLRIDDAVDPNELVGRTPDEVHVVPEAHPLSQPILFTWRNTVLGGVTSVALLVTSVVAYMVMWAFGIGPVGSLLAQGVVQEQDPVVLVDFRGSVDDSALTGLVTQAFRLELARSSVVDLIGGGSDGRLVVSGDLSRVGAEYVIASRIARADGSVLARFQERSTVDELLPTTVRLTERVRERIGEPMRTIREEERRAPVTTESAEAFDLLLQAERAAIGGALTEAIGLARRALVADSGFAIAWLRLGALAEEAGDLATARDAYASLIDLWGSTGAAERTVGELRARIAQLP